MNILLVEDEKLFAKSVQRRLERESHNVEVMPQIGTVSDYLQNTVTDLILLDVRLPDGSGLALLEKLKSSAETAAIPVIIMTAYGELDDAVQAMKLGAADYLKKPVDLDELILTINKVSDQQAINQKLNYSKVRESLKSDEVTLIGNSNEITQLKLQIERIASLTSRQSGEHPVLLLRGETGTGKDLAARLYHQAGDWRNEPFVHINCASLPEQLIEAELFGYERGAFTHASQAKAGLIEVAESGTLFLDEIGELPIALQAKLLNVLEHRKVRRLGAVKEREVKARFVVATNRDLKQMVADGTFRADLYFRLNVLDIYLPPLRNRQQDILPIAVYFVEKMAQRYALATPTFTQEAITSLTEYNWPGNIRELQHVLERAVMLCQNGVIGSEQLLLELKPKSTSSSEVLPLETDSLTIEQMEKVMIERALNRTDGNVSKAARQLGLTRMAMRYRMEKYHL